MRGDVCDKAGESTSNLDLSEKHKKKLKISYKNQRGFHSCVKNEHKRLRNQLNKIIMQSTMDKAGDLHTKNHTSNV